MPNDAEDGAVDDGNQKTNPYSLGRGVLTLPMIRSRNHQSQGRLNVDVGIPCGGREIRHTHIFVHWEQISCSAERHPQSACRTS